MMILVEKNGIKYGIATNSQELGELVVKALIDGGTITQIEFTDLQQFFG